MTAKKTRLFKATYKYCGMDKRKYAKELRKAMKSTYFEDCSRLSGAFFWSETPQGRVFWQSVHTKVLINRRQAALRKRFCFNYERMRKALFAMG